MSNAPLTRSAYPLHYSVNGPSMDYSFCAWELKRAYMTAFCIAIAPFRRGVRLNLIFAVLMCLTALTA